MNNMKFRVNSPEHSEEIQRELFRLGYEWFMTGGIIHTESPVLYARSTGHITYDDLEDEFDLNLAYAETTLEQLKAM